MCIAVYKPIGRKFPKKSTLENCFNNNPDGSGFMVATGDNVEIHKGFMDFEAFWKSLSASREKYSDDTAYVMHFRISTQGGVRQDGCHPFPLSTNMDDLRALDTTADIGVAHNGVISLTSTGGSKVDYSDTMKFITEYLSLIIHDNGYFKDDDTLALITRLCGSRLAILDRRGHCELIGSGWSEVNGVWYSNTSYEKRKVTTTYYPTFYGWRDNEPSWYSSYDGEDFYDEYYAEYDAYLTADGMYNFPCGKCPEIELGDTSFCDICTRYNECYGEEE